MERRRRLAAASDVLKGYDDALAKDCLETAIRAWTTRRLTNAVSGERRRRRSPAGASGGVLAASQGRRLAFRRSQRASQFRRSNNF